MRVFERDFLRKCLCLTLGDKTDGLPETSANNEQHRPRKISLQRRPQQIKQNEMWWAFKKQRLQEKFIWSLVGRGEIKKHVAEYMPRWSDNIKMNLMKHDTKPWIVIIRLWVDTSRYKWRTFVNTLMMSAPCLGFGPGSSLGIATGYGLDAPEIKSRWGPGFPHLSRPVLGPTQPPVKHVPDLSWG